MRITTPYFNLFTASLTQAVQMGLTRQLPDKLKSLNIKTEITADTIPVGLRWNMHKEFGFPRKPFNVYRRPGTYKGIAILQDINNVINGTWQYYFPQGEMYVLSVNVTLQAGQQCTLQPMNREKLPIPYKIVQVTGTGQVIIKCPFMHGLIITGNCTLNAISGALQQDVVNAADWQLIQTVGLPFEDGEIGGLGYDGTPQGYVGSLTTAKSAALQRLAIGALLHLPMPATGDVTIPTPLWNAPNPSLYLNYLFNAPDSLLKMIHSCLQDANDFSYSPVQRQSQYIVTKNIKGVYQHGITPSNNAKVSLPVVGTTLLAATTDSYAALGLGFGTTDFPVRHLPTASSALASAMATTPVFGFDYMVTASYIIRPFEMIELPVLDSLSKEIEFAALGCDRDMPVAPAGLAAISIQKNRPTAIDLSVTENLKLRWQKPITPQGYGIIASYKTGQSRVLNSPHIFQPNCYQTFNTFVPRDVTISNDYTIDDNDADKFVMTQPDEPVPDYGSELHNYLVAGLDVFGRWSAWQRLGYNATAIDKQNSGVIRVELKNKVEAPPATVATVACTLEIEFSWRWADRSPQTIEVAGQFYAPVTGATPPVQLSAPVRFAKDSSNSTGPVITITFDAAGNPTASDGTVSIVPVPSGTPAELKKYKLIVDNIQAVFPSASPWSVGYAVYVRALEKVRVPALDYSVWSMAYCCQLHDPRKPETVYIPADVHFTALPDAAKKARGVLTWPAAAGALMYNVWEASESAIRTAIDQALQNTFPADLTKQLKPITAPLQERANQLRDILTNSGGLYSAIIPLCDKYFNRITKEPVQQTSIELELPGSSKVLQVYRVSSVNSANIESDKSGVVFFAVPQIVKPLSPKIELKKVKEQVSDTVTNYFIDVKVVYGDYVPQADTTKALNKIKTNGFSLYKVRKQILINDPGAKGLPYKPPASPDWQDCSIQMLNGDIYKGLQIRETIVPSWKPFCYQAVAYGKADAAYGEVSGESDASVTAISYWYPDAKPQLVFADEIGNPWSRRLALTTDAPFFYTDKKSGMLEVHKLNATTNQLEKIKSWALPDIEESSTDHLLPPLPAMVSSLPVTSHRPSDAAGITRFSVVVPRLDGANAYKGVIRIYDPLGRFSDFQF